MWRGVIHLTTPMLFACGFLFTFVIGGLSGIFLAVLPVDINVTEHLLRRRPHPLRAVRRLGVHDLRGHLPLVSEDDRADVRREPRQAALLAHVLLLQRHLHAHALAGDGGDDAAGRRLPAKWADLNFIISICAFVLGASTLVFLYNMAHSWWKGAPAPANPWRALTLEWQVTSPPPIFNFDEPPQIVGSPYAYGVPGARHAIVTVHVPPAARGDPRAGRAGPGHARLRGRRS